MVQNLSLRITFLSCVMAIAGAAAGDKEKPAKEPRVTVKEVALGAVPTGEARKTLVASPDNRRAAYLEIADGKVIVVSPAADANSTTVQVWIQIENPGEYLKPGTSVHAAIVTEAYKAATVVPVSAILPGEEGGTAVLTVSSDSTAHKKAVKLGIREGSQVQVLSGVAPGEEVVVVGGMGIDDKAKVKVVTTAVEEAGDEDENAPEEPAAAKDKKGGKDQKKDEAKPKGK